MGPLPQIQVRSLDKCRAGTERGEEPAIVARLPRAERWFLERRNSRKEVLNPLQSVLLEPLEKWVGIAWRRCGRSGLWYSWRSNGWPGTVPALSVG
jgi:hypothetical protein